MVKLPVAVKKLRDDARLPLYGTAYSAGADLFACMDEGVTIAPQQTVLLHTGLCLELPEGTAGLIYARSGLALRRDLAPANKVGVIDSDYRGELCIPLHNHGSQPQRVEPGDRIAQLILTPYLTAEFFAAQELSDTLRAEGGFGSTGR